MYLMDERNNIYKFTGYAVSAKTFSNLESGTVISISNFNWIKQSKGKIDGFEKCRMRSLKTDYEGKLIDESEYEIEERKTEKYKTKILPDAYGTTLYTSTEIETHFSDYRVKFNYSDNIKEFSYKAGGSGRLQSHFFSSADNKKIRVTFFNDDVDVIRTFEEGEVYRIKGSRLKDVNASKYYDMDFGGHFFTEAIKLAPILKAELQEEEEDDEEPNALPISLEEILTQKITEGKYEIRCIPRSTPVTKGNIMQMCVLDGTSHNEKAIAVLMNIDLTSGKLEIKKAEEFVAGVTIKKEGTHVQCYAKAKNVAIKDADAATIDKSILTRMQIHIM